ncbi:MAG: T9SS C-terminal target domain-containing protein [Sphingobacteriales bacterium]|nr:MAG: T9SS C-terminal target domain-containing protein [Sphingobacteriales bacterium]
MIRLLAFIFVMAFFCPVAAQTVTLSSSNLPIIVINTGGQEIPNDPKITADMGIIYNGTAQRNNITDPLNHYNGKIGIEIRGQSSQSFPMKSYSIELRDNAGASVDKSLFGLPKEADWVLYAPYTDKTLMRNFLAYTMSREMGHWAANCRFVEVMVNGDYKGIYVFMERIKRGSGRVNIPKLNTTDIAGDAVTGGYIFSLDKEPNGWFSSYATPNATTSNNKRQFSYVYPKPENIVQAQKDYLKSYTDSFENALAGPNFQDAANGVRRYADINSFIDYFIVNEISRNVDGYRLSTYMYKDRASKGGKIIAGPVWDYDLAFRNADYCAGSNTSGWAYEFNLVCPADGAGLIPFWWNRFLQKDTAFQATLRCRWKQLRQNSLSDSRINTLIDSVVALTNEARIRHFQRWQILGKYVWPNPQPIASTYDAEIEYLKGWLNNRTKWITDNLPNTGVCFDYPVTAKSSFIAILSPNPITASSNFTIQSKNNQSLQLKIYSMQGQVVQQQTITLAAGMNSIPFGSGNWSKGVYLVVLQSAQGEKFSKKILVE